MASDFLPQIDPMKCTGCGLCLEVCPGNVLRLAQQIVVVAFPQACDYIGACEAVCPNGAITLIYEIIVCDDKTQAR